MRLAQSDPAAKSWLRRGRVSELMRRRSESLTEHDSHPRVTPNRSLQRLVRTPIDTDPLDPLLKADVSSKTEGEAI